MPNITLRLPADLLDACRSNALLQAVHDAAAMVTGLGNDPRQQALSWVMLEELQPGHWLCGGHQPTARAIPCQVRVLAPAGALDAARRADYAHCLHEAITLSLGDGGTRPVITSIVIEEVADGRWAANGQLWDLRDFIQAAGYVHLQPTTEPT